jgi:hypothetical protein
MSPQVRLPFIPSGNLNTANSPVDTGQYEPITGLPLPSGISPGAWFDMTESEAQAYSKIFGGSTGLQQLHAGRYQWVQLSSTALVSGTGQLQLGQALLWVVSAASTLPPGYIVTNVPSNATSALAAGVCINTVSSGKYPVTPGNWFFMQSFAGPGRATVLMRAAITAGSPAIGDTIVALATAAGGADTGLFDDIQGATVSASELGSVIGTAEAVPADSTLLLVDIVRQIGG